MVENNSYIKLFRKFLEWEWYQDDDKKILFLHCLLKANFQDKKWQGQDVPKGSFVTSYLKLADELGWDRKAKKGGESRVRRALKKLQESNEIIVNSKNKNTLITIVKWGDYQVWTSESEEQTKNKRRTNEEQTKTTKECKESKNVKNDKNNILFAPSYDSSNAVFQLATIKANDFYYLHNEDIEKYKTLYPAVDVEQQLRNMVGWLDGNPKNRKTHGGVPRFINNWLSKEQNKTRAYSSKNTSDFLYNYEVKDE